jgi:hypothetical protein
VSTTEVARFFATSTGCRLGDNFVIGPVLVTVEVTSYEWHRASYTVSIDGRHQFGGFADHLPSDVQDLHAPFLVGRVPASTTRTVSVEVTQQSELHDLQRFDVVEAGAGASLDLDRGSTFQLLRRVTDCDVRTLNAILHDLGHPATGIVAFDIVVTP